MLGERRLQEGWIKSRNQMSSLIEANSHYSKHRIVNLRVIKHQKIRLNPLQPSAFHNLSKNGVV